MLANLRKHLRKSLPPRQSKSSWPRHTHRVRPQLECLEDRVVPACFWKDAVDGDLLDPTKWGGDCQDRIPGLNEDALIDNRDQAYTVTVTQTLKVREFRLNSPTVSLNFNNGVISALTTIFQDAQHVELDTGGIDGLSFENHIDLEIGGNATISAQLVQLNGTLTIAGQNNLRNFVNNIGGSMVIVGSLSMIGDQFQNQSSLSIQGTFEMLGGRFLHLPGGDIAGGVDIEMSSVDLQLLGGSGGRFAMKGTGGNQLSGNVERGQVVRVLGPGAVSAQGSITNDGLIELVGDGSSGDAHFVGPGTLTITDFGTLRTRHTGTVDGAKCIIGANVTSDGTIDVKTRTGFHAAIFAFNSGTFGVDPGASVDFSVGALMDLNGANLDIGGTFTVFFTTFRHNGGSISSGAVTIVSGRLEIGPGATGKSSFIFQGTSNTLVGDVKQGQTIRVQGLTGTDASVVTQSSLTNDGTIVLENVPGSVRNVFFILPIVSKLTNNPGGIIQTEGGPNSGLRGILGDVDNQGTINVNARLEWNKSGGRFEHRGAMNIQAGIPLVLISGTFVNDKKGTISGGTVVIGNRGARFEGEGTLATDMINDGTLAPGIGTVAPGLLGVINLTGNYTQTAGGNFEVDIIANADPGIGHDQLVVQGSATLAGRLIVKAAQSGLCAFRDFVIMAFFGGRTGNFSFFSGLSDGKGNPLFAVPGALNYTIRPDPNKAAQCNTPPTANAGGPYDVDEGGTIFLDASGSFDDQQAFGDLTYEWDLDDDGAFGETGPDALRGDEIGSQPFFKPLFNAAGLNGPGSVTVFVEVTDAGGLSSVAAATVTIKNVPPTVDITGVIDPLNEGNVITATANVFDPGPDSVVVSWTVFLNGTPVANSFANPFTFTVPDNGQLEITAEAEDSDGDKGTTTQTVQVDNVAPTSVIKNLDGQSFSEGSTANPTADVQDPGTNDTFNHLWNVLKDGQPYASSTNESPSFFFNDNGTYLFQHTVTDDDGDSSSTSKQVIVVNKPPQVQSVQFSPDPAFEGQPFQVDVTASDSPADQSSLQLEIDCGGIIDPLNANFSRSCTIKKDGTHDIGITVVDKDGGKTTVTVPIDVLNLPPVVDTGGPYQVKEDGAVQLDIKVTEPGDDPVIVNWDLDLDGIFGETGKDASRGDEVGAKPTYSAVGQDGPFDTRVFLRVVDNAGASAANNADTDNDGINDAIAVTITVLDLPAFDRDFGDAPDPAYPTLMRSDGARHRLQSGFFLGTGVDADTDGLPSANADGDDLTLVPDDEDGVAFHAPFVPGGVATLTVTASAPGILNAFVDFNRNGTFNDPGEQLEIPLEQGGNFLRINVPDTALPGPSFARFRFSSAGGLGPIGLADDGEVEDYPLDIRSFGGAVLAFRAGNRLFVVGDAAPNAIRIEQAANNRFVITGLGNTLVNGQSSVNVGNAPRLFVLLDGGDDLALLDGHRNLPIQLRDMDTLLDQGNDVLQLHNVIIGGQNPNSLRTNAGDDLVEIIDSLFANRFLLSTGAGNDEVVIRNSSFEFASRVSTEGGDDLVTIDDSIFDAVFSLFLGEDNDRVEIERHGTVNGPVTESRRRFNINLGNGADLVAIGLANQAGNTAIFRTTDPGRRARVLNVFGRRGNDTFDAGFLGNPDHGNVFDGAVRLVQVENVVS